jgi:hypothetical protein
VKAGALWKPWTTLQAEVALAGKVAELTETDDGRPLLVVIDGALTKQITDLRDGRAWLDALREGSHA